MAPLRRRRSHLLRRTLVAVMLAVPAATVPAATFPSVTAQAQDASGTVPEMAAPAVPYPARLFAPLTPGPVAPDLAVRDMALVAGDAAADPEVAVRFREPFALPRPPYRVSVLVGEPAGARVRASLVATGGTPQGSVETSEGAGWRGAGSTSATFDPSGVVVVRLPASRIPAGGSVWMEIARSNAADAAPVYVSPTFSHDALFGLGRATVLPAGTSARPAAVDGAGAGPAVALPPGPTLTIESGRLTVTAAGPPPSEVGGNPVTGVVDIVRIARRATEPLSFDELRIDRTAATISLVELDAGREVDRSGDRRWLVEAQSSSPGASPNITVDLALLGRALDLDPSAAAYGLARSVRLGDGRTVAADAVLGTGDWFDLAPVSAAPTTTAALARDVDASYRRSRSVVGATLLALVLVGAAAGAVVVVRRRRRAAGDVVESDRTPADVGRDDGPTVFERLRVTASVPAVTSPVTPTTVGEGSPGGAGPVESGRVESGPVGAAPATTAADLPPARPRPAPRGVHIAGEEAAVLAARGTGQGGAPVGSGGAGASGTGAGGSDVDDSQRVDPSAALAALDAAFEEFRPDDPGPDERRPEQPQRPN